MYAWRHKVCVPMLMLQIVGDFSTLTHPQQTLTRRLYFTWLLLQFLNTSSLQLYNLQKLGREDVSGADLLQWGLFQRTNTRQTAFTGDWFDTLAARGLNKVEGIPQYIYPYSVYYLYLVLKNNILVLMWHIFTLKFFLEDMDFFLAFFCWQMLLNDLNISFNNVTTAADCISPCCTGFINLQDNSSRETFLSRHNRSTNEKIRRPLSFISPTRIQSLKLCRAG